jgi:hypothetical protein
VRLGTTGPTQNSRASVSWRAVARRAVGQIHRRSWALNLRIARDSLGARINVGQVALIRFCLQA